MSASVTRALLAALALTAAAGLGCAHRVVVPPLAEHTQQAPKAQVLPLAVRGVTVRRPGMSDVHDVARWRRALVDHLNATLEQGAVALEHAPGEHGPVIDLLVELDQTTNRTYLLDLLGPFTYGLLVPAWGDVHVEATLVVHGPDGVALGEKRIETSASFTAYFFAWFRLGYVEDAFEVAYAQLFGEVSRVLRDQAALPGQLAPVSERASATLTQLRVPDRLALVADGSALALVRERRNPMSGPLGALLGSLGGVEGSLLVGKARVSSQARGESGERLDVAAGSATQRGYRIATYAAPRKTGWFVAPELGFLDQRIDIADFRETLPTTGSAEGREIAARCSDPATLAPLDCNEPNVYDLHLRSGYLGAHVGADVVVGNPWLELFARADATLNLAEYRDIVAKVGRYRARGGAFETLSSGAAGVTLGARATKLHLGTHVSAHYQLFREFEYAEPLEFKGFVTYNPDKNVYERPRTFVSAAHLGVWSFAWSVALSF